MSAIDETHDPATESWVASANGHPDFPIQNLPFGVFTHSGGGEPRGGVAIGDAILDLAKLSESGLFAGDEAAAMSAAAGPRLNPFLSLEAAPRIALRRRLFEALRAGSSWRTALEPMLHNTDHCRLLLPAAIGDYTDFYAGIAHAENVGRLFRPDNPLLPNYKYVPIGYHGRASSIRPSGAAVRRPLGQLKRADVDAPTRAPSARLDYELEVGIWIGGSSNALGTTTPIAEAGTRIAGLCLLNDWSARDIQAWEYQPLGPFLAKNFMTTISPWIVTMEALAPYRIAQPHRPAGDPAPLDYLWDDADQKQGAFALTLEVFLSTQRMRETECLPYRLSRGDMRAMYWTAAQLVTHHASGGCDLQAGDLLGTGTLSGEETTSYGSLLELSRGGTRPIALPTNETRTFLLDGDEVSFKATFRAQGYVDIGFGECTGRILPAAI